jgi:hypothetical protein
MYLDTRGYVAVGAGELFANRDRAQSLGASLMKTIGQFR